jgi:exonuclease I
MTFVLYDTEPTGTDTAFDQILQFGAIRMRQTFSSVTKYCA